MSTNTVEKVYVSENVKIGKVSKNIVSPRLLSTYNLIFRRLPLVITQDELLDTFDGYGISKVEIFHNGGKDGEEEELVACLRLPNKNAKILFEKLNGKVIAIDGIWYPIEMMLMEDYIKLRRSLSFELVHTTQQELIPETSEIVIKKPLVQKRFSTFNFFKNIGMLVLCFVAYQYYSFLVRILDF